MSHTTSPKRSYIVDLHRFIGQRVTLYGFAEAIRDQKRIRFIVLRDLTGKVQLVQSKDNAALTAALDRLTPESQSSPAARSSRRLRSSLAASK